MYLKKDYISLKNSLDRDMREEVGQVEHKSKIKQYPSNYKIF